MNNSDAMSLRKTPNDIASFLEIFFSQGLISPCTFSVPERVAAVCFWEALRISERSECAHFFSSFSGGREVSLIQE